MLQSDKRVTKFDILTQDVSDETHYQEEMIQGMGRNILKGKKKG